MTLYTPAEWIAALNLSQYGEGGYFRETYRSAERLPTASLPARYGGERSFASHIYFLLEGGQVNPLHRLKSDELWHFYAGSPLILHVFHSDIGYTQLILGPDPAQGQSFQLTIPAGAWFGATLADPAGYCLAGCTVAPGFDPADFELGQRAALLAAFPKQRDIILKLAVG
jgi:hypothetical protein